MTYLGESEVCTTHPMLVHCNVTVTHSVHQMAAVLLEVQGREAGLGLTLKVGPGRWLLGSPEPTVVCVHACVCACACMCACVCVCVVMIVRLVIVNLCNE